MTIALCPGSFDPATNGHLDIIRRASDQFETVIVGVLHNPAKAPTFTTEERIEMLKASLDGIADVISFEGLTVDACKTVGATVLVRGLRTVSDFDGEEQMAQMNARLGVDTAFFSCEPAFAFISASLIKEVVRYGGSVAGLVSPFVEKRLIESLAGKTARK